MASVWTKPIWQSERVRQPVRQDHIGSSTRPPLELREWPEGGRIRAARNESANASPGLPVASLNNSHQFGDERQRAKQKAFATYAGTYFMFTRVIFLFVGIIRGAERNTILHASFFSTETR